MKIEVDFLGGKNSAGIFVHRFLGQSVGVCIAAFAHALLSGHTQPGVWYPEVRPQATGAATGSIRQCRGVQEPRGHGIPCVNFGGVAWTS